MLLAVIIWTLITVRMKEMMMTINFCILSGLGWYFYEEKFFKNWHQLRTFLSNLYLKSCQAFCKDVLWFTPSFRTSAKVECDVFSSVWFKLKWVLLLNISHSYSRQHFKPTATFRFERFQVVNNNHKLQMRFGDVQIWVKIAKPVSKLLDNFLSNAFRGAQLLWKPKAGFFQIFKKHLKLRSFKFASKSKR